MRFLTSTYAGTQGQCYQGLIDASRNIPYRPATMHSADPYIVAERCDPDHLITELPRDILELVARFLTRIRGRVAKHAVEIRHRADRSQSWVAPPPRCPRHRAERKNT